MLFSPHSTHFARERTWYPLPYFHINYPVLVLTFSSRHTDHWSDCHVIYQFHLFFLDL